MSGYPLPRWRCPVPSLQGWSFAYSCETRALPPAIMSLPLRGEVLTGERPRWFKYCRGNIPLRGEEARRVLALSNCETSKARRGVHAGQRLYAECLGIRAEGPAQDSPGQRPVRHRNPARALKGDISRGKQTMITLALMVLVGATGASEVAAPPVEAPAFFAGNDELRGYLLEAAEKHPGLKALHEEWLAALERIPQARALEDPMLTYKQFVQSDMKEFAVMFEQAFPWFGTLRLRGEKAAAEAEAAQWRMYAERNRIFAAVKKAYFEYAYLGEQIRVTEEQIEIIDYAEEVVRAKYSLGLAAQDDLLRIQNERDMVADMRAQMLQMQPALAAKLNEALGRPLGDDLPWPQPALFPPDPPAPPLVTAWIRLQSPELKAADSMIAGREKEIGLARRMGRPEIRLGLEYERLKNEPGRRGDPYMPSKLMAYYDLARTATGTMPFDAGDSALSIYDGFFYREPGKNVEDDVAISLGVILPVWRKKIRGAVAEARHMTDAAKHDKEATARALDAEARMALFGIQDGQRRIKLYEESLIPRAKQAYESVQAAYASGAMEADFLDMLESVRELLNFDLERVRAIRDLQIAASELEMLIGGPWAQDRMISSGQERADVLQQPITDGDVKGAVSGHAK